MTHIVLMNGPAGCGKTASVSALSSTLTHLVPLRFKDHLHTLTQQLFCVDEDVYWNIYNTREIKEIPNRQFRIKLASALDLFLNKIKSGVELNDSAREFDGDMLNVSIREAMIFCSECVAKPAFSDSYFGDVFVKTAQSILEEMPESNLVEDSTAFKAELNPLIETFGQESLLLIRIYGRGEFVNDSRSYIPDNIIENTVDIWNNGSEQEFLEEVERIVSEFINEEV